MLSTAKRRRPRIEQPADESAERPASGRRAWVPGGPESRRERLKVAVLLGGPGHEREVSLVSGREVAAALTARGHEVVSVVLAGDDERELDAIPRDVDAVFLALHGEYGEDGQIQAALACRELAYTGSGPEASARAYDKLRAKRHLGRARLPLAQHLVLPYPADERAIRHAVRMTPPERVVVKPARMGSSVGVVICEGAFALRRALEEGQRFAQPLLIEEFIPGHELTCGILDGEPLPVVEAVPERGFFDYQAKYDKTTGTRYVVDPPHLPREVRERIQRVALRAHRALGCEEMSRVDFRYDPTRGRLAILELNTIPGLTPTSLLPKAAAAVGIPFGDLCERLCRLAMRSAAA